MSDFRMPSLGADMESGTLVEWLKHPGDHVSKGDIMAVVETQKGAIEIEIFEDGEIEQLLVEPGQKVPVGTAMALINGAGAAVSAERADVPTSEPAVPPPSTAISSPRTAPPAVHPGERLRISPAARRRAEAAGLDPAGLIGSGEGGAVTLRDVETAVQARPGEAPREPVSPREAMRQAIAAAMERANREIPHYHLAQAMDVTGLVDWLEAANAARPVTERMLPGALFLKAVALALRAVPDLNGFWEDGAFRPAEEINVGWAISLRGGGLIAPAIHRADELSLDRIMAALRDVVGRARAGGLRSSELSDASVTVTSLGDNGVETVHGVIYPPQVSLVGLGRIERRPWVVGDTIVPRSVIVATLAADHRASDGQRGAKFLNQLDRILREPDTL